jgi:hypothetical protein
MLETRMLLLSPALDGQPRAIADAETNAPRGFALWQSETNRWWTWLRPPLLSVHEQEEAPLIFTVRPCGLLGRQQEVRDAEDQRIGYLDGTAIRDRNYILYAQARLNGNGIHYENPGGDTLAIMQRTPEGTVLTFTKLIEADPFAKMLLLAAALLQK